MVNLEILDNKEFAFGCLNLLIEKGCLNETDIRILTSESECKWIFSCSKFPILSEVSPIGVLVDADCYDERGRQRFYKEKIYVSGHAFVVSNHWYGPGKSRPDNRTPFLEWVWKKYFCED